MTFTAIFSAIALALGGVSAAQADGLSAPSGIDVADHQHPGGTPIKWKDVKSDGQHFAFVKASEGNGWVNPYFTVDALAASQAGLKVGAYHYARPSGDAKAQAAHFATQLALVPKQTLPPVLDIEVDEGKSPAELERWISEFTGELRSLTGRMPMIYTYKYFWLVQMNNSQKFANMPLWLAAYQDQAPAPVGGWDQISFWQRSGSGRVDGVTGAVDMNVFNGSLSQLEAFNDGNYVNLGGALKDLAEANLPDLSSDSAPLIAAILALAAGAIAVPQVAKAAQEAGLTPEGAGILADFVRALADKKALPIEDLVKMAAGHFSVGDLSILLDNAGHLAEKNAGALNAAQAAAQRAGQQGAAEAMRRMAA